MPAASNSRHILYLSYTFKTNLLYSLNALRISENNCSPVHLPKLIAASV